MDFRIDPQAGGPSNPIVMHVMKEHPDPQRRRVVLFHHNALFRDGLARVLAASSHLDLVAECASSEEASGALRASAVDVVLMDYRDGSGAFIVSSRAGGYQGGFLVLAPEIEAGSAAVALRLGASGIFLESGSSARLLQALELVANGEAWVDPAVVRLLAERYPRFDRPRGDAAALTERQRHVLQGVVDGLTNQKIGSRLGLSESSVKGTLQQLFARTGVRTRSQLVRAVLEGSLGEQTAPNRDEPSH